MTAAKLTLFPDQAELKSKLYTALRSSGSVLAQACTGFGKSALAIDICLDAIRTGKSVTINVPRVELLKQMAKSLRKYGIQFGYISAKYKPNPLATVQISTTETMARRLDRTYKTDLLIVDECHVGGESLSKIIAAWKQAGRKIVGLSATPRRMDGKGMDVWFDDMVCGPQMRWLIDNGRLNRYVVVVSDEIIKAAQAKGASEEELDRVMFGDAVKTWKEHAAGLRTLGFCRSIKHAEDLAQHYSANGIPAAAISSKTPDDEMERVLQAFARREILVIMNVQVASFGWDLEQLTEVKGATVECVQMHRFSSSLPLYMQIAGRFLRVGERESVFIDHTGVIAEHGLPCADREWSLDGELKGDGEGKEKLIPTRQCPVSEQDETGKTGCGMVHSPKPVCPRCGFKYPVREMSVDVVETEMLMLTPEEFAAVSKQERQLQGRAKTYKDMVDLQLRKQTGTPNRKRAEIAASKVLEGRGAKQAREGWFAWAIGGECEWSVGQAKAWARVNGVRSEQGGRIVKRNGCVCVVGVCEWPQK